MSLNESTTMSVVKQEYVSFGGDHTSYLDNVCSLVNACDVETSKVKNCKIEVGNDAISIKTEHINENIEHEAKKFKHENEEEKLKHEYDAKTFKHEYEAKTFKHEYEEESFHMFKHKNLNPGNNENTYDKDGLETYEEYRNDESYHEDDDDSNSGSDVVDQYSMEDDSNMSKSKYQCNFCSRRFGKRSYLEQHEASHTGEKKHICKYCNQGYQDMLKLTWD
ncbi:Hypothetical predicted protein [Mytilus galloprovincialis]|uniref:C2H2-type domain-containing protein n=1 Tax=Mytilus galloprovincialis TaxID=29158 RepID=A0A8B6D4U5_MYTGA|nr:Hypothetical predicted protein [Mytilus galloprovincialis]